jgi:hypothetical protein
MKRKIRMICYLKSGQVVKETFHATTHEDIRSFKQLQNDILGDMNPDDGVEQKPTTITFGYTTISVPEIAAIKFY